jgi:hypothetical protein
MMYCRPAERGEREITQIRAMRIRILGRYLCQCLSDSAVHGRILNLIQPFNIHIPQDIPRIYEDYRWS